MTEREKILVVIAFSLQVFQTLNNFTNATELIIKKYLVQILEITYFFKKFTCIDQLVQARPKATRLQFDYIIKLK